MTQFNQVRIGQAGTGTDTRLPDDIQTVQTSFSNPNAGRQGGVPIGVSQFWTIVPATSVINALATTQTVSGAPATVTLAAGTSITTVTINNASYYALDVPRALLISGVTSVTAASFTITGLDQYFKAMTQTITGPAGFTSVTTTKAFAYVSGITVSGNTTTSVTIGTADRFGAPYNMAYFGAGVFNWNNAVITSSAGFTAADTTTATAATGDVRGTYSVQSAADGVKRLTCQIAIPNVTTTAGAFGVVQA